MTTRSSTLLAGFAVVAFLLAACGGFGPPPECTAGLGGTADEAVFAQYFNSMEMVNQETGLPGNPAEHGEAFAASDSLVIRVDSREAASVRACVQNLSGQAIALDQSYDLGAGEDEIVLGTFAEEGTYVARMILDGVLVKNFPFTIQ